MIRDLFPNVFNADVKQSISAEMHSPDRTSSGLRPPTAENKEKINFRDDHLTCNKTAEQEALLRAEITLVVPLKGCL